MAKDREETGHLEVADLLYRFLTPFVAEKLFGEPGCETDAEHLLVSDGKACSFCKFLHRLYRKIGADRPVCTEDNGHDNHQHKVILTKCGKREENQPVSRCRLLHLYVTGCKERTAFCDFVKTDEENVYDKSDEKQSHNVGEAFSEYFLYARCNCILSIIRVDHGCCEIEAIL